MWYLLWLLPAVFLVWAVVLMNRKARKAAANPDKETLQRLEERLAALDDPAEQGESTGPEG